MKNIKRLFLALTIIILGTGVANAEGFRFGIKAGLNLNSLKLDNFKSNFDKDNGCGYTVGIMGEFQVPLIGLGFDLSAMYTRMNGDLGFGYAENNNLLNEAEIVNKNFIEIPLNIKYKISIPMVSRIIAPYVFTGPDFAFRLGKSTFEDIKYKKCQVAWNVGLGVELLRHLQISGSYGFGMNNIANFTHLVDAQTLKVKNNYWTITAAYLF